MRQLLAIAALLLLAATARAGAPETKDDWRISESSRWSSFVRLVYGRWDVRAHNATNADANTLRQTYWHCIDDAWFIAYSPLLQGVQSPCGRLVRALHPNVTEDEGAPHVVRERYRTEFSAAQVSASYGMFRECANTALENGDTVLLEICSHAMRPRERVVAALTDDERFNSWFGACKKLLIADVVLPQNQGSGETIKPALKPLTEIEKTQARHCFRTLPALYEVRWLNKLSDFWTPEEQRALYLRSQQLGQN